MTKRHQGDSSVERAVMRKEKSGKSKAHARPEDHPLPEDYGSRRTVYHCRILPLSNSKSVSTDACWSCSFSKGYTDCTGVSLKNGQLPERGFRD